MRSYQIIIIIGASRSGTNLLRNVLTSFPQVGTWPCDEINAIWRHGNVGYPSDEFTPDMVRPEIQRFIQKKFDTIASRYNLAWVVEKTCANSLRVDFVDQVFPEAKYIFLHRDGLDAVGSAIKRWKAKFELGYVLRKARFVPPRDIPYYAVRYLGNRLYKLISHDQRLAFWGPRLNGMDALISKYSLIEVCALQWKRCVDAASDALAEMSTDRWIKVAYENFVRDPEAELLRIIDFLGSNFDFDHYRQSLVDVHPNSIGKGRKELGENTSKLLMTLIQDTMARYDYA
jgi:LPS sulfotransferase NodH